jgi:hypothetical protein
MSLAVAVMQQREETKRSISLEDIPNTYFEFVEKNVGFIRDTSKSENLNAHQFARMASESSTAVSDIAPQIAGFVEALEEFWKAAAEPAHYHIQDLTGLKAVYGGDLFPSHSQNIASSVGLYTDTIILGDPFLKSRHIFDLASDREKLYYFFKHSINVLKYKDLALAKLDQPLVVMAPYQSTIDDQVMKTLSATSEDDAARHASRIFNIDFESFQEVLQFCEKLPVPSELTKAIVERDRFLLDVDFSGSIEEQIREMLDFPLQDRVSGKHAGRLVAAHCFSRMSQAGDVLMESRYLGGVPLIEAPTSWKYFIWYLVFLC